MSAKVSSFYGMSVYMHVDPGQPAIANIPHFHVRYGSQRAAISIEQPEKLIGELEETGVRLVVEWAAERRGELNRNLMRIHDNEPPEPVPPLD